MGNREEEGRNLHSVFEIIFAPVNAHVIKQRIDNCLMFRQLEENFQT